jgi:hypothetical protein
MQLTIKQLEDEIATSAEANKLEMQIAQMQMQEAN